VCVHVGTRVSCTKLAEPIEMLFGADLWGQDQAKTFAATRGDKTAIQPSAKSLWTFV